MNRFGKAFTAFVVAGMMLSVGVIVLSLSEDEQQITSQYLSRFYSADELKHYLRDSASWGSFGGNGSPMSADDRLRLSFGLAPEASHSETNIQVSGVDEADEVKTDGRYLYISNWNDVRIVKAYPPDELSNVSTIDEADILGDKAENYSLSIDGIFVKSDKLVIIGSVWRDYDWWYYYDVRTVVDNSTDKIADLVVPEWEPSRAMAFVFDISDVTNPILEFAIGITGSETTSRMIGDYVYLVAHSYAWVYDSEVNLPRIWTGFDSAEIDPDQVYYDPETREPSGLMDVMAINIASGEFSYRSIVAGYASTVYMSQNALYLSIPKWNGQILFDEMGNRIVDDYSIRTTIYRVDADGTSIQVTASGEVKGWLRDQFSMDEYDNHLRVATTTEWSDLRNAVYVLDSDLQLVGAVEDIAPGERVFSSRFVGDTLYLVTFRQIDPLFVIDLSDPQNPEIKGELEMPGFSSYLHPIDEDHVLGIGQEDNMVKVSMYDVSDPANPVEQSKVLLDGYTSSSAQWDHKAVLFDQERELLVIPVNAHWWSDNYSFGGSWNGFYVFGVSVEDGVWVRGTIECMNWSYQAVYDADGNYTYRYVYYDNARRAVYIGDYLYSLSSYKIRVNLLSDLSEVTSMIYRDAEYYGYYVTV